MKTIFKSIIFQISVALFLTQFFIFILIHFSCENLLKGFSFLPALLIDVGNYGSTSLGAPYHEYVLVILIAILTSLTLNSFASFLYKKFKIASFILTLICIITLFFVYKSFQQSYQIQGGGFVLALMLLGSEFIRVVIAFLCLSFIPYIAISKFISKKILTVLLLVATLFLFYYFSKFIMDKWPCCPNNLYCYAKASVISRDITYCKKSEDFPECLKLIEKQAKNKEDCDLLTSDKSSISSSSNVKDLHDYCLERLNP